MTPRQQRIVGIILAETMDVEPGTGLDLLRRGALEFVRRSSAPAWPRPSGELRLQRDLLFPEACEP